MHSHLFTNPPTHTHTFPFEKEIVHSGVQVHQSLFDSSSSAVWKWNLAKLVKLLPHTLVSQDQANLSRHFLVVVVVFFNPRPCDLYIEVHGMPFSVGYIEKNVLSFYKNTLKNGVQTVWFLIADD